MRGGRKERKPTLLPIATQRNSKYRNHDHHEYDDYDKPRRNSVMVVVPIIVVPFFQVARLDGDLSVNVGAHDRWKERTHFRV
jgi:hypothetical protein